MGKKARGKMNVDDIFSGKKPQYIDILNVIYDYTLMDKYLKKHHLNLIFVEGFDDGTKGKLTPSFKTPLKKDMMKMLKDAKEKNIVSEKEYKKIMELANIDWIKNKYTSKFKSSFCLGNHLTTLKKLGLIDRLKDKTGYDFYVLLPKGKYAFERYYLIDVIKKHIPNRHLRILLYFAQTLSE